MTFDEGKGMTIKYNYLNLPREIVKENTPDPDDEEGTITWVYDATGRKLRKTVNSYQNGPSGILYLDGIEKHSNNDIFVYHAEGRAAYYFPGTEPNAPAPEWQYEYTLRDHLGNSRVTIADKNNDGYIQLSGTDWLGAPYEGPEIIQENHYYPFGLNMEGSWHAPAEAGRVNKYQYNGKEWNDDFGLNWNDYGARWYDAAVGRWNVVDLLAEKHFGATPYNYVLNNPLKFIDLFGLDTLKIHVIDQDTRPTDKGTSGETYSAEVYVLDTDSGNLNGPYKGSSYPNSKSNTDNSTESNTVNEGDHSFNNNSGHKGGTKKGLNLVNSDNERKSPGTAPDGTDVGMQLVNVHAGASDNGNYNSRGSQGCITICPGSGSDQADSFFQNFDWSGTNGTTGNSEGKINIQRLSPQEKTQKITELRDRAYQIKENHYNPVY